MFCAICGATLLDGTSFCHHCGRHVTLAALNPARVRTFRIALISIMLLLFCAGSVMLYKLHIDSPLCPTVECADTH